MTALKEAVDVRETSVPQGIANPKPESGGLRSDAVSLDIPVKVHGSRVTDVVRGTTPHTEPFEEQTTTMIVFPLGGVLRMSTPVSVGQAIVLTNLKSRQDAICRVVKIRTNPNLHSYVEIEFTHPQPGYWGVYFASDDPALAKKGMRPAPAITQPISAPAPSAPVSAAPETETAPKTEVSASEEVRPLSEMTKSAFSLADLRGDAGTTTTSTKDEVKPLIRQEAHAAPAAFSDESGEVETLGAFTPTLAAHENRTASANAFGTRLGYGTAGVSEYQSDIPQAERKSWIPVAAVIPILLAAAGVGVFYFHRGTQPSGSVLQASAPPAPEVSMPGTSENSVSASAAKAQPATPSAVTASSVTSAPISTHAASSPIEDSAAKQNKAPHNVQSAPVAPANTAKNKTSKAVPDMFGALNAHPVSGTRESGGQSEAPAIDASANSDVQGGLLQTTEAPSIPVAPPQRTTPDGPVSVGGIVKPPRLITAVNPVYPSIAQRTGIEGKVLVQIVIDKAGNVTGTKVISGPPLLRPAAVDALRQQKYEPTILNGQPVSVEMLVTVEFHQ